MLIRNTLQQVGKTSSLFLFKKEIMGKFVAAFSSRATAKARKIASLKLNSKSSLNSLASQIQEPHLSQESRPKSNPKNISYEQSESNQRIKKDVPWLKPFVMRGIIDSEAERKFLATFNEDWISDPSDFVQIDLDKATYNDLIDLLPLMVRDIIDPKVEEKITQICNAKEDADLALTYANPELDRLIKLNQGRIENIEDFDLDELEYRADLGVLDQDTSRRVKDLVNNDYNEMIKLSVEDEDLTDYSAYLDSAFGEESIQSKK
ncbi:MAG: hypothetical protein QRY71_04880 [Candidatus Rhabdochlamydia sp.]